VITCPDLNRLKDDAGTAEVQSTVSGVDEADLAAGNCGALACIRLRSGEAARFWIKVAPRTRSGPLGCPLAGSMAATSLL